MKLHVDFETRSASDLIKCGIHVYSTHPTTDIVCMGYAFNNDEPKILIPNDPLPSDVKHHIEAGLPFVAHNAAFEFYIWNNVCARRYGWPKLKLSQLDCTMARAYAMGLPGSLEKAAAAMGITNLKDIAGGRVMLQVSQPREINENGDIVWWTDEEKLNRVYDYCKQDVRTEVELDSRLLELIPFEKKVWQLDFRINHKGVAADIKALKAAQEMSKQEKERLDSEIKKLTYNAVATCNAVGQFKDWAEMYGVKIDSVAKQEVVNLLSTDIPPVVKTALKLRQEAAKSSTAKLLSMINSSSEDGRIRGIFQYHGAGTGRWAGRRIQPQNFPRSHMDQNDIDAFLNELNFGITAEQVNIFYGQPLTVISESLRGFLVSSPGFDFIAADFSSIEARVLAWLAGEQAVLDVFAEGGDVYKFAASAIYKRPPTDITKDQRQIGKVAVLALGYQGGYKAFQTMAKNYGVVVSKEEADNIKNAWRERNPKIVRYWYALEDAARSAIQVSGQVFTVGNKNCAVKFLKKGSFLLCRLPSGRSICYPYPKMEEIETPWGETKLGVTYMSENSLTRKFEKHKAYGGLFAENITQAVSRDILVDAMIRVDEHGYSPVMHIHDEIVTEVQEGYGSVKELEKIMSVPPTWATGLPISAEGWRGKRFRK